MPMTIRVDQERNELSVTAKGPISLGDIKAHLLEEEEGLGLGYRELIDASGAYPTLSPADIRTVVEILRDLGRKGALGPTAIVVPDDVTYGMCRMLEMLVDDVCDIRPFRISERAEAEQWLATAAIRGPSGPS